MDLSCLHLTTVQAQSTSEFSNDSFVDLYYKCFHSFHPFVLPHHHLQAYLEDKYKAKRLKSLISVIRHIGSLYARTDQRHHLATKAATDIRNAKGASPTCPFLCQAQLLYSIALFWSGDRLQSQSYIDDAIAIATRLGMSRQEFANAHSDGDPVLAESWRRTWWQIYIVDYSYSAIKHDTVFPTRDILVTVDLPCEEHEYESGVKRIIIH